MLSPRPTARVSVHDIDGQLLNEYAGSRQLSLGPPATPWAMYLAGPDRRYRFLAFDLDAKGGRTAADADHDARALATTPKLILLDEPAAGMNPRETEDLKALIRAIRDELGVTVVLIEHDMRLVMGVTDRIVVLGRDVGGPEQQLTTTTVADFDPAVVDMRTMLIIGSSATTVAERSGGRLVFTPRHHTPDGHGV